MSCWVRSRQVCNVIVTCNLKSEIGGIVISRRTVGALGYVYDNALAAAEKKLKTFPKHRKHT